MGEAKVIIEGTNEVVYYRVSQDIIGEMAVISQRPRSANCIATTDITALRIDHDSFWDLMADKPVLALGVIKVLAQRLDENILTMQHLGKT